MVKGPHDCRHSLLVVIVVVEVTALIGGLALNVASALGVTSASPVATVVMVACLLPFVVLAMALPPMAGQPEMAIGLGGPQEVIAQQHELIVARLKAIGKLLERQLSD